MVSKTSGAILTVILAAAMMYSCGSTRSLAEGEYTLAKNRVEVVKDSGKEVNPKDFEKYIQQKANSYIIFGWNPFLDLYNLAGRDTSKFMNRIIRKIGTPPVIFRPSAVETSKENINRHLEYLGYYNSDVESEVVNNGKKVEVTYTVTPGKRYIIDKLEFSVPEGEFRDDFMADTANVLVKRGDYLAEAVLEEETERSASWMRKNGWFGFNKNYYAFEADTLQHGDSTDLVMSIREYTRNQAPESAAPFRKYHFGDVSISWDKDMRFNDRVLRNMNTIRSGSLYNEVDVNNTYSRLSALRLFSGVNIALNPRDTADIVDCDITLTRSRVQGFKINLEASTNSNGLIGTSPQISYFHKNIFHGGQWLNLSFLGNFQFLASDRKIRSNEFGASAGVSFPEFLGLPNSLFHGPNIPRTEINTSFSFQNRPEYTRAMFSASFGYSGAFSRNRFLYQFYPLQAKIIRLNNIDPDFLGIILSNNFLWNSYSDHFDVGAGGTFYYTTCPDLVPKISYRYVRFQFDASGNVFSLFNGLIKQDEFGSHLIMKIPYSQYVRAELTLGNTFVFGRNDRQALAFRLLAGYGLAYGNSSTLPFEKQFYAGGANSMRGWQARTLGPGRSDLSEWFSIPSQSGDTKFEANVEYRFPLFWKLQGALFADAGNIWYARHWIQDSSALRLKDFGKSIALDWGIGTRIDLTFLILRFDLGVKLYDPSMSGIGWYSPSDWRRKDCYALHFGVGYPF
ncbi:MAG: BamA/TamA family outer membrane protein [Bacteroidales bacterium]|nr:BamA/TamA family outer membrane protein [Bacteroidales bacterium]